MLTELSSNELLGLCLGDGSFAAWQEFTRRFHPAIAGAVAQVIRKYNIYSADLTDELLQETYLRLCEDRCRILREFRSYHPHGLVAYLRVVARNLTEDHCKSRMSLKGGGGKVVAMTEWAEESWADPRSGPEAADRELLLSQIEQILSREWTGPLASRDKHLFWLYFRSGWSSRDISLLPRVGLTQKGVESVIQRMVYLVRAQLVRPDKGYVAKKSF